MDGFLERDHQSNGAMFPGGIYCRDYDPSRSLFGVS